MERDFYLSKDLFYCMCKWALGFHNGSAATLTVRMRLHFLVMTTTVAPPPDPPNTPSPTRTHTHTHTRCQSRKKGLVLTVFTVILWFREGESCVDKSGRTQNATTVKVRTTDELKEAGFPFIVFEMGTITVRNGGVLGGRKRMLLGSWKRSLR